jgi:hypothetical protein
LLKKLHSKYFQLFGIIDNENKIAIYNNLFINTVINKNLIRPSPPKVVENNEDEAKSKSTFYIPLPEDAIKKTENELNEDEKEPLVKQAEEKTESKLRSQTVSSNKLEYVKQISENSSIKSSLPIMNQVYSYFI